MQNQKQNGFTLTELIVTVAVFAVLIPVMGSFIAMIDGLNDRGRDLSVIHALVENKIEGLRSVSFIGVSNGTTNFTNDLPVSIGSPRSATYTISSINSALKQVDVEVTYNDHGAARTLAYRTYLGELGVGQY